MPEQQITDEQLEQALAYVAAHPEIQDVLLSGGDPLAVGNKRLLPFLRKLASIAHVKVVRIDSRAVSTVPARIDEELVELLRSTKKFWYYAHINHPDDLAHPEVEQAVERLRLVGVPVLNQCVMLRGVNDNAETMCKLMEMCYHRKILPYHLYILDRVQGAAHFSVPEERFLQIWKALSRLPGPAQPVVVFVDRADKKHRAVYDDAMDMQSFFRARDLMTAQSQVIPPIAQPHTGPAGETSSALPGAIYSVPTSGAAPD